ncbi:SRPBCC family protein [Actinokineospora sp.]|uniref:SRPBCC family protein n=1 Tax=Actinokineospora sp. TaxID=1872133 RepID=UPI0040377555
MTDQGIEVRAVVLAPPAVVREALTDAHALRMWFAEHAECALADGRFAFWGRYTPFGAEPRQRLLSAGENRLRFGWTIDAVETTADIRLEPTRSGDTQVCLAHHRLPGSGADLAAFWGLALGTLAGFVEGRSLAPKYDYTAPDTHAAIDIDAPVEEVFAALAEPARLDRWIAATGTAEPRIGQGPVEIVAMAPPRRLAYHWRGQRLPDTVVRWAIESAGLLTRVHMRHTGGCRADRCRLGWRSYLVSLQRMVELGCVWPPLDRAASSRASRRQCRPGRPR